MDRKLAQEIINCLPKERSLYAYYKDYYALQLLNYFTGEGTSISTVKQSRYAKLLNKSVVKKRLADCGDSRLLPYHFARHWCDDYRFFALTLGLWDGNLDGWSQTSRRGWNLVLQLNFSNQHNSQYYSLVKPMEKQALNYRGHPVFRRTGDHYFRETLAWARIDVDFDKNECLIEEIQSDWVRDARSLLLDARFAKKRHQKKVSYWPVEGQVDNVIRYCQYLNSHYANIWPEAMLSAVLFFIKSELGIRQVYYHSCQSGHLVKKIGGTKPPSSLYSNLPRAFCFQETLQAPEFLQREARYRRLQRKVKNIRWYEMAL